MNKRLKDFAIIGFALFAMFFGAGNLIFPPSLGKSVGSAYLLSSVGFIITGVGLPLLGILACVKSGGSFENMAGKVSKPFAIITTTALMLAIGPMLAIPRTAATTFELSIQPLFPSIKPITAILIYFFINLCFVLKPNSIIDNIGKFLTPILLIMLSSIIIKGIIFPIGPIINTGYTNVFSNSLLEGYQTMDAMASVIFASIVISSVKAKGYKEDAEITSVTIKSGIVAVIGLSFIYGGLLYLGSQTATLYGNQITKTKLVMEISRSVLGNFGAFALSISVGVACLTTSIGLTATGAKFFTKISNNKIPYNINVFIITISSIIISLKGVDTIVAFAGPILQVLYPIVILLILTSLLQKWIKNNKIIAITIYVTFIISLINTLNSLGIKIVFLENLLNSIPLADLGFVWIIPALITFVVSYIVLNNNQTHINFDKNNINKKAS
ncbi:branched-chain amino acid transport system II carrier protein [Clostridium ganghwense]|uniref:Branched-chain amino acid transport system carrier protein n=1 Tax=Clostridium ganghwense TaxID=312089 RepID=A0ABT4CP05_9CLOT|nr:branched-chain amino acid transport system II carrier protein [Clostridium ganghwense]MCY6370790.1 branched-chain amino acid transport system II carrier protein [Clostridium ganghwense]